MFSYVAIFNDGTDCELDDAIFETEDETYAAGWADRALDENGDETDEAPVAVLVVAEDGSIPEFEMGDDISVEAGEAVAAFLEARRVVEV